MINQQIVQSRSVVVWRVIEQQIVQSRSVAVWRVKKQQMAQVGAWRYGE